jgi:hypothetical protein
VLVATSDKEEGDGSPSSAADGQEGLLSTIAALQRQLAKKKKGGSINLDVEVQRQGKLFTWNEPWLK